jgi:hypothetical protein
LPPGSLALEPVLVPCNRGCFFAWIDPAGAINIQVIDDCGYRKLASPFVVAGTSTQLVGCAYAHNDGAKNQLFLAYTTLSTGGFEELRANVFTYDVLGGVPTITPGTAIVLHTTSRASPVQSRWRRLRSMSATVRLYGNQPLRSAPSAKCRLRGRT